MMYEAFFQLTQRPFSATAHASRYFPAHSIEAARLTLARSIQRDEGPGMLIGGAGTGKTLLLEVLAQQFADDYLVVKLAKGHPSTRRELLQTILHAMGLPYRGLEEGELRLALFDHLAPTAACPRGMLLLVDEAGRLPLKLVEEIRMITNYVHEGQPRVRLVLAGDRGLEERFASPQLESFTQRIAARCYLAPLERLETIAYVRGQLAGLGGDPHRVFALDALETVHQATDGVPRLINQLCDHALVLAYAAGRRQIDAGGIEEAWADLQQLPTPWNETGAADAAAETSVVEFGELDEEPVPGAPMYEALADAEPLESGSPIVRLDAVADQLASWQEEFELPGPMVPTIRESAREAVSPFAEQFQEEEIIVDRFAPVEVSLGSRPAVRSAEGSMLSAMLEPFMHTVTRPQLSVANPPAAECSQHCGASCITPTVASAAASWKSGKDVQVFEVEIDADLMIVEDDPEPARPPRPQSAARRQEYRQLFAKLRRG
jgi:type II secretory pathway predicted ATPase ExeA